MNEVSFDEQIQDIKKSKYKEEPKQVMVVRKDLNMRKGKLAAQCAHASMKVFFDRAKFNYCHISIDCTEEMVMWADINQSLFVKIVVYVNSEQELHDLKEKADYLNIPNALILDAGRTEFKEPTYTCLAVGPDDPMYVDEVTGNLPLL